MAEKIAERFVWAVELLNVQADDQLLEIGCGHGIAVSLICEKLTSGKIVALDRSQKMIDMAQRRNEGCDGKSEFHVASLKEADLNGQAFNKIFCVNVNVFWQKPQEELAMIRQLLADEGTFYIIYEPPTAEKVDDIIEITKANLEQHQFTVVDVQKTATMMCIQTRPA